MKRGEALRYAISFALIGAVKVVRGLKKGLSEAERHEVAAAVVLSMKNYGDPWRLDEEMERSGEIGHGTPIHWHKPSTG
jgi:hypothetical protein